MYDENGNENGNRVRRTNRRGWVRQFVYDSRNLQTGERWYDSVTDAGADQNRQNTFAYDYARRVTDADDTFADYAHVYDMANRAEEITHDICRTLSITTECGYGGRI